MQIWSARVPNVRVHAGHAEYEIEVRVSGSARSFSTWKRYSEFAELHARLARTASRHGWMLAPVLPPKALPSVADKFIQKRRAQLHEYITAVASQPELRELPIVLDFLSQVTSAELKLDDSQTVVGTLFIGERPREITVAARGVQDVRVRVPAAGAWAVAWEFESDLYDVGFQVTAVNMEGDEVALAPYRRARSHKRLVQGYACMEDGMPSDTGAAGPGEDDTESLSGASMASELHRAGSETPQLARAMAQTAGAASPARGPIGTLSSAEKAEQILVTLRWDNTYSKFRAKTVRYRCLVVDQDTIQSAAVAEASHRAALRDGVESRAKLATAASGGVSHLPSAAGVNVEAADAVRAERDELAKQLGSARRQMEKAVADAEEAASRAEAAERRAAAAERNAGTASTGATTAQSRAVALESALTEAQVEMDALRAKLQHQESAITDLTARCEAAESASQAQSRAATAAAQTHAEHEQAVASLRAQLQAAQDDAAAAKAQALQLRAASEDSRAHQVPRDELDAVASERDALADELRAARVDLAAARADRAAAGEALMAAEHEVEAERSAAAEQRAQAQALSEAVAKLKSQRKVLSAEIKSLRSKLAAAAAGGTPPALPTPTAGTPISPADSVRDVSGLRTSSALGLPGRADSGGAEVETRATAAPRLAHGTRSNSLSARRGSQQAAVPDDVAQRRAAAAAAGLLGSSAR